MFRLATFNCESLFSRPRIFGLPLKKSLILLDYVKQLQEELSKDVFDQTKITALKKKLSGYATIEDIRGKHTTSPGATDWLGWVELTRRKAEEVAIDNLARLIGDVNADVITPIEVESRTLLQKFHDDLLYEKYLKPNNKAEYRYILLIDGNDERGIDVSLMSRVPILDIKTHIYETTTYGEKIVPLFSRDCLEVSLQLHDDSRFNLLINHFKSQGYSPSSDPQSNRRRLAQAQRVADLVSQYDLQSDYVAVMGDLNSDPTSPSLEPLLNVSGLYNVNLELPLSDRGTYRTGKDQLDYILISDALKTKLKNVYIERHGMYSKTKYPHYPTIVGRRSEASDHAVVVADFEI